MSEGNNRKRKNEEYLKVERERRRKGKERRVSKMTTTVSSLSPKIFIFLLLCFVVFSSTLFYGFCFCVLKATHKVILNKTMKYIKELEEKKKMLEEMKESRMKVLANPNCSVSVSIANNMVFFSIETVAKPLATAIVRIFLENQADILSSKVSVDDGKLTMSVTALVQNEKGVSIEKIKSEIMKSYNCEVFMQGI